MVQGSDGRGVHSLAPVKCNSPTLDVSCAWHMEPRSKREAVAHKGVISLPRLLLPHVGFHSITIASQELHT